MTCHYIGICSIAMLLAIILCHLCALAFANPFHKYPFVFLLDVGNEELERVNTEQIRISTPGGSIALRYPAVGQGDTISHVRVSGIDFGTDLKANIVDGGPGYKYVVLVFMGNPEKPYDAVLTVQTVPDSDISKDVPDNSVSVEENDPNDSAEDLSDSENDSNQEYLESSKAELMQSSSNVYNYAQDSNDDYIENDGYASQKDIHNSNDRFSSDDTMDYAENEEDESLNVIPKDEEYDDADNNNDDESNNEDNSDDDNDESSDKVEEQSKVFDEEDDPNFNNEYFDKQTEYEDSEELDQTFNDEEVHGEKYKESHNNNYGHSEDSSVIDY